MYLASLSATWIVMSSSHSLEGFLRSTPLGFRHVVQHVRLHVAAMSELVNLRKDGRYEAAKVATPWKVSRMPSDHCNRLEKFAKLLLEGDHQFGLEPQKRKDQPRYRLAPSGSGDLNARLRTVHGQLAADRFLPGTGPRS